VVRRFVLHLSPDSSQGGFGAGDFGKDVIDAPSPDERLGVVVVMLDVLSALERFTDAEREPSSGEERRSAGSASGDSAVLDPFVNVEQYQASMGASDLQADAASSESVPLQHLRL
jgi:hypothetical protein